jgi:hypothetical protein
MTPDADRFGDDLTALVDVAFAPDAAALERIRAQMAAEFRVRAAASPGDARGGSRRLVPMRPAAAFALAFGLLAGSFGLVAANSGPGQPFYGLRLAAEELTLPASGATRLRSQLARLEDRLAEARREAQAGDPGGVGTALDAYRHELWEALTEVRTSGTDIAPLLDALAVHEAALNALESIVPASAESGIHEALDQVSRAAERLRSGPIPSPSPTQPGLIPGGEPDHSPIPRPERTSHPVTPAPIGTPPTVARPTAAPPGASHRPSQSPGPP